MERLRFVLNLRLILEWGCLWELVLYHSSHEVSEIFDIFVSLLNSEKCQNYALELCKINDLPSLLPCIEISIIKYSFLLYTSKNAVSSSVSLESPGHMPKVLSATYKKLQQIVWFLTVDFYHSFLPLTRVESCGKSFAFLPLDIFPPCSFASAHLPTQLKSTKS